MFTGQYEVRLYKGPEEYEKTWMVLTEKEGNLGGAMELLYMQMPLLNGKTEGSTFSFRYKLGTIYADMEFNLEGKVDGNSISGTLGIGTAKMPFFGQRTA